jgi:glycerol-3-phosphate dehydrogenase
VSVTIRRDVAAATNGSWDLVCVGGGIYGTALALEAARRGLRPLLVERDDFGAATSWHSLRIVHGGLRYLQSLDLTRHRESVGERRWFLQNFPDQVHRLPCLMPLYGHGKRSPAVFRAAFLLDALLGRDRNAGVVADRHLPAGGTVSAAETIARFPGVVREGLSGAALWTDAAMPDSQRLLMEMLRWAVAAGAKATNYVEATGVLRAGDRVKGIEAVDRETGDRVEFRAPIVVNCAGPWVSGVATAFDRYVSGLFHPSCAFNLLLDRKAPAAEAVAVSPRSGSGTYFLHPWKGMILAGTAHRARSEVGIPPTEQEIHEGLADLNSCLPGSDLGVSDVLRVHWGTVPAVREGAPDMSKRPVLHDHAAAGGPSGLFSVSGVKFTTARLVAERTLRLVAARAGRTLSEPSSVPRPAPAPWLDASAFGALVRSDPEAASAQVRSIRDEEAVMKVDDLLLRRTDWGMDPRVGVELERVVRSAPDWREPVEAHGSQG